MLKSIKWKIFFGFLVLALMLFVAGGITIYEFISLNRTVNSLLEHNYSTIQASINMLESIEQEDSGILLILSGDKEPGNKRLSLGDSTFQLAYAKALQHSNLPQNRKLIQDIKLKHDEYKSNLSANELDNISNMRVSWYLNNLYPEFNSLKTSIKNLMIYNQDIIYSESNKLRDETQKAVMPGIVAILSALVMSVIFTYFINKFFVNPLSVLTRKVEDYKITGGPIDADIQTQDELKQLESAIQDLIYRLRVK